jgi:hypothetical protein
MDFSAAWVVLIGAHAGKPSHAGVRFHAFTMRATGWLVSRSSSMVGGGVLAPASIDGAQCRPAGCVASHPGHRCTSRSPKGSRSRTSVRWSRRDGGGSAGAGRPPWRMALVLWKKSQIGGSRSLTADPETLPMVDGRRANSTLQGQRSRRGPARLRLGHPDHGDAAISYDECLRPRRG